MVGHHRRVRFLLVHSPVVGPVTWQWVSDALVSRGHTTALPDLRRAALTGDPIAAAIPTAVRTVFVDAGMPPCDGVFSAGGEFVDTLRRLAIDGVLPVWSRWWGEGAMETLVRDDARRRSIEQELPAVPLAFFEHPMTAPAGWCSRTAAFVLLSEPYRSDAERARSLNWTVVERLGTHLDIANDEKANAGILERI